MTNVHLITDESIGGIKREYIEVKRGARVGNYVLIVNADYTGGTYGDGDILRVSGIGGNGSIRCDDIANADNYNGQIDYKEYVTLVPTDIVVIDGTRYQLAERKAGVGEKVLDISGGDNVKVGGVYEIIGIGGYTDGVTGLRFIDDAGDARAYWNTHQYRVLIPVDSKPAEPTTDIYTLLANAAMRITQLERITGELVRAKSSVESQLLDAQRNIERLAQELETEKECSASIYVKLSDLKDEVESNTKDIAFLDERTYEKPGKRTRSAEEILREISKIFERDDKRCGR